MNKKSTVCKIANQLVKEGYNRSDAFVAAWQMVNNSGYIPVVQDPVAADQEAGQEDLTAKVLEYKKLQKEMEELEEKIASVKEVLIAELEAQETTELQVDIFKVRYITVTSNRFATTEFKESHKDLYNAFLKESTCKRFTVA